MQWARIVDLFSAESDRLERFCVEAAGLRCDLSRTLCSKTDLNELLDLARQSGLAEGVDGLFGGELLNSTEQRAALHTALRGSGPRRGSVPYAEQIAETRAQMRDFAGKLRSGEWRGFSGEPIRNVVSIGIGGSHLGPAMVVDALAPFVSGGPRCHFVANVDPADLEAVLVDCVPASTLFVVASKTFTTLETIENARAARRWMLNAGCGESGLAAHFVAVSAWPERAVDFGISADRVYPIWEWVGGRYSLWSAIGLPIEVAVGSDNFDALLEGAGQMDVHFRDAPWPQNMPLMMALLGLWQRNFLDFDTLAVIAYDHGLRRLPDYLQQLMMESNGKLVSSGGVGLNFDTSGILWGAAGTNTQHSFHQLLHQGTARVAVEFILPLGTHSANVRQHSHLVANCLSQSQALLCGRSEAEANQVLLSRGLDRSAAASLAPHLSAPGNRPSTTVTMNKLEPRTLGALIALYEHRTFCEGWIWGINSFDQFGVELGKELSTDILSMLISSADTSTLDPSTRELVEAYRGRSI